MYLVPCQTQNLGIVKFPFLITCISVLSFFSMLPLFRRCKIKITTSSALAYCGNSGRHIQWGSLACYLASGSTSIWDYLFIPPQSVSWALTMYQESFQALRIQEPTAQIPGSQGTYILVGRGRQQMCNVLTKSHLSRGLKVVRDWAMVARGGRSGVLGSVPSRRNNCQGLECGRGASEPGTRVLGSERSVGQMGYVWPCSHCDDLSCYRILSQRWYYLS